MATVALGQQAGPASSAITSSFACSLHRASLRCVSVPCFTQGVACAGSALWGLALRLEVEKQRSQGVVSNAGRLRALANEADAVVDSESGRGCRVIHGKCFVVGDNIDTDQIIPAEYLTLVPSKPEEYEKLGSYAMIGLPAQWGKFIEDGAMKTEYKVIIGGGNFGCGSSR